MKTIIRSIGLGMLAAVFIAASSSFSYAQAGCDETEKINELDAKIREAIKKTATLRAAMDSGKEFLEKFGACEATKEFTDWLKAQMPGWETRIAKFEKGQKMGALIKRFDDGINNQKPDEVYAAGKEILIEDPKNVHVMIPLGLIALTEMGKNNNKFNEDALRYGKLAIENLKAGAQSKMNDGKPALNKSGQPAFSTWDFSKEEAIDELTYAIAFINFYAKKDKKTALPMYYELSQSKGRFKDEPRVYAAIADYYISEKDKLGVEIAPLIKKGEELEKKTVPAGELEKHNEEIKQLVAATEAKVGLFNGYAERALDALGRAHKVAPSTTAADKTYKEMLSKQLEELYKQRFDKDKTLAGLPAFLSKTLANPFPNPLSEVKPIIDPDPVTTTSTTTGTTAAATAPATKPAPNGKPPTKP